MSSLPVAVGAGLAVFAPNLIAGAVPLLIVAACPLSMLVMMRMMSGQGSSASQGPGPGADDGASVLREQLTAVRLEQDRLERELARLETADRGRAPEARIKTTAREV